MHTANLPDEAVELFEQELKIYQNATPNEDDDSNIALTLYDIGLCHIDLGNYSNATIFLRRALEIYQNITVNADEDKNTALTLRKIGICCMNLNNYSDALTFQHQALKIFQNLTINVEKLAISHTRFMILEFAISILATTLKHRYSLTKPLKFTDILRIMLT